MARAAFPKGRFASALRRFLCRVPLVRDRVEVETEVLPEYREVLARVGLDTLQKAFSFDSGRQVTVHRSRGAFRVEVPGTQPLAAFYVKTVSAPPLKEILESVLRFERPASKCRREWTFARKLAAIGIGATPVAAFGEARLGAFPFESFLVTQEIAGSVLLDNFLAGLSEETDGWRVRRDLARRLAGVVAEMHSAGLFHRDLYAKHIFVKLQGGGFAINIIDLQRMREGGGLREVVRDLAGLNVSLDWRLATLKDRLRFLKLYCRSRRGEGSLRERELAVRIFSRSVRISPRSKLRAVQWRHEGTR